MEYSGKTTTFGHKFGDGWKSSKGAGNPCIQTETIFEVQWTNCPVEVAEEVKKLWRDNEFGNDHYYASWNSEEMSEDYPIITEFLKSQGVTKCLIHYWW